MQINQVVSLAEEVTLLFIYLSDSRSETKYIR